DVWAQQWGRAYVEFAAEDKLPWLREQGIKFSPLVGWAERGDLTSRGHGNSVPRFHVPWGTGTAISDPFVNAARSAANEGFLTFHFRHQVDELVFTGDQVTGVHGTILAADNAKRGVSSNRKTIGTFEFHAQAAVMFTGWIGGNHQQVRRWWAQRLATAPKKLITGVPAHVDERMLDIANAQGVRLVNRDRMWHYTEGLQNWAPMWPFHAIPILP